MAGVVRAELGTVAIVRVTGITGRRFATSKPAFETAEVFLDLVERPLVLFLQLVEHRPPEDNMVIVILGDEDGLK